LWIWPRSISPVKDLQHLNIMITAGPTREPLDPVRYITNHSSGKMGFAIAAAAAPRANVTLVSGPVSLPTPPFVQRLMSPPRWKWKPRCKTALSSSIFIGCAAVADYRAVAIAEEKIKKQGDELTLKMVKNPDIVAGVAALKPTPFTSLGLPPKRIMWKNMRGKNVPAKTST
jgi:phosphopantothenoylcysteine decarboxylase/phosphopantothenate--cysteine ligase